jgi:hypothetical protein
VSISSCAGLAIALFMDKSLQMYSGLNHHPSDLANSASTCGGITLYIIKNFVRQKNIYQYYLSERDGGYYQRHIWVLPIIKEVIVVLGDCIKKVDICHPFNHSATNVSRDNNSDRITVVG